MNGNFDFFGRKDRDESVRGSENAKLEQDRIEYVREMLERSLKRKEDSLNTKTTKYAYTWIVLHQNVNYACSLQYRSECDQLN